RRLATADLDGDGRFDVLAAGKDVAVLYNQGGKLEAGRRLDAGGVASALAVLDLDNDGRLHVAAAGPGGIVVLPPGQGRAGRFARQPIAGSPRGATTLVPADLDGDGDLDLVTAGPAGLAWLENHGGNRNHWLAVRLRGLDQGNGKNNHFGLGATVEVRD